MNMKAIRIIIAALALVLAGGRASALTSCGALLTNSISATFGSTPGGAVQFLISYASSATVKIDCPQIVPTKTATPTLQAAGQVVVFRVWIANTSPTFSAFNVAVIDRLPDNMEWAGIATAYWTNMPAPIWTPYNAGSYPGPYAGGAPTSGQDAPWYLRWTLDVLGPGKSGYVEFQARIL
jgi:uncharacterized repeat protein (TIGR01451 family)